MPIEIVRVNDADIRYDLVPVPYMVDGLRRYMEQGIPPGDFLSAVIANDLFRAAAHADDFNRRNLFQWVQWFYNYAPVGSYGSTEIMRNWMAERRKMLETEIKHEHA